MSASKFDIDSFIEKAIIKDFLDIFHDCERELTWLESIKFTGNSPFKNEEWQIERYRDFIHEFMYILHLGGKPAAMKEDIFQRTKPIIEALVKKGQFNSSILKIYD